MMQAEKEHMELSDTAPPSYNSLYPKDSEEILESKDKDDKAPINNVIASINRMSTHTPRYQDQCASLSEVQKIRISAATLAKDINRLSRGQYTNQRAVPSSQILIQKLSQYNQQGLASQRFSMTEGQQRNLDLAKVSSLVSKMESSRLENQDWKRRSQVCEEELEELLKHLNVAEDAPLNLQRYTLSGHQQRAMFIRDILSRIGKLEELRMLDQDAELQTVRKEQDFKDLERSLNRLPPAMNNQRAVCIKRHQCFVPMES